MSNGALGQAASLVAAVVVIAVALELFRLIERWPRALVSRAVADTRNAHSLAPWHHLSLPGTSARLSAGPIPAGVNGFPLPARGDPNDLGPRARRSARLRMGFVRSGR
jgi:hypothetical protein